MWRLQISRKEASDGLGKAGIKHHRKMGKKKDRIKFREYLEYKSSSMVLLQICTFVYANGYGLGGKRAE